MLFRLCGFHLVGHPSIRHPTGQLPQRSVFRLVLGKEVRQIDRVPDSNGDIVEQMRLSLPPSVEQGSRWRSLKQRKAVAAGEKRGRGGARRWQKLEGLHRRYCDSHTYRGSNPCRYTCANNSNAENILLFFKHDLNTVQKLFDEQIGKHEIRTHSQRKCKEGYLLVVIKLP